MRRAWPYSRAAGRVTEAARPAVQRGKTALPITSTCCQRPAIIEDGRLDAFKRGRYAGWDGELGRLVHAERTSLASLADLAVERKVDPQPRSGRQEWLENLLNRF